MKPSRFPLTSVRGKPAKQVGLKVSASCDRPISKLPPSKWTNYFHSVLVDVSEMDVLEREIEALKPNVREMLMSSKGYDSVKKRSLMIYLLVSLGLAYHFEEEIEKSLKDGFEKIDEIIAGEDDLYTISTIFWVFRTYGYNMSSDVFRRFKEENGKFKESLIEDARGMLSLYEAAHLGTTTDYILDEALDFASNNLVSLAEDGMCPSHLSTHIRNALSISQHWNMEIIVAVQYIRFYEQEVGHDEMLLKFAKLNFNLVQRLYLQEVKILTKWYKDQDIHSKLPPYYRPVVTEMHFFSTATFFEPQFSHARILQTKLFMAELLVDDTCDRYATFSEVESLINSLQRWAPDDAMDTHPDYLKVVFKFILNAFEECEKELRPQGRSYSLEQTKEEYKRFAKSNLDLAKLAQAGNVPSFEEYMEVGKDEIGAFVIVAGSLMGMDNIDAVEAYDFLKSRSKFSQSSAEIVRYLNDLAGFEDDMRRGCVSTGLNCYMNQYGVTETEVFREFRKMVMNTCKIMNEEFLKTTDVPLRVLKTNFSCVRSGFVGYNEGEGVTYPEGKITKYLTSLYVDQI
ncbi:unnamed protein product [Arabidopsis thaliana]|nr:Isoprenoid synthase domain superfamily [Arabidopsis thaliana x Arabidopsis arenosa]VYS58989.1 unnamed protein product [Arabidopsis thaliana]